MVAFSFHPHSCLCEACCCCVLVTSLISCLYCLLLLQSQLPQEVKNSIFGGWCACVTAAGFYRSVTHAHLPVGHTHEDIGHLMAFCALCNVLVNPLRLTALANCFEIYTTTSLPN